MHRSAWLHETIKKYQNAILLNIHCSHNKTIGMITGSLSIFEKNSNFIITVDRSTLIALHFWILRVQTRFDSTGCSVYTCFENISASFALIKHHDDPKNSFTASM